MRKDFFHWKSAAIIAWSALPVLFSPGLVIACGNSFNEATGEFEPESPGWEALFSGPILFYPFRAFILLTLAIVAMLAITAPYWLYRCELKKHRLSWQPGERIRSVLNFGLFLAALGISLSTCLILTNGIIAFLSASELFVRLAIWGTAFLSFGFAWYFHGDPTAAAAHRRAQAWQWWRNFVFLPSAKCYLVLFALSEALVIIHLFD